MEAAGAGREGEGAVEPRLSTGSDSAGGRGATPAETYVGRRAGPGDAAAWAGVGLASQVGGGRGPGATRSAGGRAGGAPQDVFATRDMFKHPKSRL